MFIHLYICIIPLLFQIGKNRTTRTDREEPNPVQNKVRCNEGPIGFALDVISQWHKNFRFVHSFLAEMEAFIAFSRLENWGQEGYDPSKPVSLHPTRLRIGGDYASSAPGASRGSSEGT